MRRPPQFSRAMVPATKPLQQIIVPARKPAEPSRRAWQEDGRFGAVLIVSVTLVNFILILLVGQLPVMMPVDESTSTPSSDTTIMPSATTNTEDGDITLYADPEVEARLDHQFDLNHLDPRRNELSISPQDIPAPEARALDKREQ